MLQRELAAAPIVWLSCAESAIQSMDVERELADYDGPWH